MPHYGPDCNGCGGEDCICCSTYMEAKADANDAANADYEDYDYEYADLYGEVHDNDSFEDEDGDYQDYYEESNQDYYSRNDGDYQDDDEYEYKLIDTPLGDQFGNGFDEN